MSGWPLRAEMNPLWRKGLRSRCRPKYLLSWGTIWLTLAIFVFLVTYLTLVERGVATKAEAAKAALPGILVIQAVILMLFGTGAVASGVSQERDEGLLDYVRMTPMSPTSKVIGYLFGLPAREYLLFAATLPLVLLIVLISGFSLVTLAHFYLVFFTSVMVYHSTAMVVGMASPNPRLASFMSTGLVVLLYFALPNLSRIGITFFEFLTIRPTFLGLIQQELPERVRVSAEQSGIDSFRPVPFFGGTLRPTVYSLMVQGFLIAVMFSVVHRKWRDQSNHLFSKPGALAVFGGVTLFTFASLWAIVAQDDAYQQLFEPLRRGEPMVRMPETFLFLVITCLMILGAAYMFLVCATTPSANRTLAGFRQARRAGRRRIGWTGDAASSLPIAAIMIATTLATGVAIISLAISRGDYLASPPSIPAIIAVVMLTVAIGLFVQGVAESMSRRAFAVSIFLVWMIPFFAMVIFFAGFEAIDGGLYSGQPFPPVALGYATAWMLETAAAPAAVGEFNYLPPRQEQASPPATIVYTGVIGYTLAAVAIQTIRWRRRTRLATASSEPGSDEPASRQPSAAH